MIYGFTGGGGVGRSYLVGGFKIFLCSLEASGGVSRRELTRLYRLSEACVSLLRHKRERPALVALFGVSGTFSLDLSCLLRLFRGRCRGEWKGDFVDWK